MGFDTIEINPVSKNRWVNFQAFDVFQYWKNSKTQAATDSIDCDGMIGSVLA